jgi:cytochrome c biogenesis protein CcmG/thiol:disulfide interchange protein DsbE
MPEAAEQEPVQEPVPKPVEKKKQGRKILLFCGISLVNVGLLVLLLTQLLTPAKVAATDPLVGRPAPNFSLAMLTPQHSQSVLSLAELKGKPIVLNFWASWCAPCKEEMPLLEQTWQQLQAQEKDVVFLGIDFQEPGSTAASFLQLHNITYPIVLDTDGAVTLKYGITGLPQTVFITRQGTVASRVPGELTAQTLAHALQSIL